MTSAVIVSIVATRVSHETGVPYDRLLMPTRGRWKEALARQLLMYLLHQKPYDMNFTDIGRCLNRYRRTVSHGVNLISQRRQWDKGLDRQIKNLARKPGKR